MTPTTFQAIRKRHGFKPDAMATALRVGNERTIRRWEYGECPISGPASILMELLDAGVWVPGQENDRD